MMSSNITTTAKSSPPPKPRCDGFREGGRCRRRPEERASTLMFLTHPFWGMVLLLCASISSVAMSQEPTRSFRYPEAPRSQTVEDYHGIQVADPLRPLEDLDAAATRAWVEAENKITFAFLESTPQRPVLRARLTELWDYEKFSPPQIEAGKYFFTYNTGLQNQSVLYVAQSMADAPRVLLDPNALSRD